MDTTLQPLFEMALPSSIPEDLRKRHDELRQRFRVLEKRQAALESERANLFSERDPFLAADQHRRNVLAAWRVESDFWSDVGEFSREACEALRQARLETAAKRSAARDEVRRKHFAQFLEDPADYQISADSAVVDADYKAASIASAERRWIAAQGECRAEAAAADQRVRDAIAASLRPILEPLA